MRVGVGVRVGGGGGVGTEPGARGQRLGAGVSAVVGVWGKGSLQWCRYALRVGETADMGPGPGPGPGDGTWGLAGESTVVGWGQEICIGGAGVWGRESPHRGDKT